MPKNETTYTQARENFAKICDQVNSYRQPVIIHRRGAEDVALISLDELRSLEETAHLMRSPENARRLLEALHRALSTEMPAENLDNFRQELGLAQKKAKKRAKTR